ncbi:hypothetical protein LOC54_12125, partial [Acetobacter sp. AN02]|uniref:hypothetical protein n=1 Tax=Acetobacter sp. AN02 TaxID=2894186 RepID=UPI0024344547
KTVNQSAKTQKLLAKNINQRFFDPSSCIGKCRINAVLECITGKTDTQKRKRIYSQNFQNTDHKNRTPQHSQL